MKLSKHYLSVIIIKATIIQQIDKNPIQTYLVRNEFPDNSRENLLLH